VGIKKIIADESEPDFPSSGGGQKDDLSLGEDNRTFITLVEPLSIEAAGTAKKGFQKVGWGEFEPADKSRSTNFMRYLFLNEIREVERKERGTYPDRERLRVLEELSENPLREFERARLSDDQVLRLYANPSTRYELQARPIQDAVEKWAKRWHLEAEWCQSTAFTTLQLWHDYPEAMELQLWDNNFPLDNSTLIFPEEISSTVPLEGVLPFFAHIELRSSYELRTQSIIEEQLKSNPFTSKLERCLRQQVVNADMEVVKDYCNWVMEVYDKQKDAQGAKVWERVAERSGLQRNIQWTIDFQVRGKAALRIARDEETYIPRGDQGLSHSTVLNVVYDILDLIDLPRRADVQPGRPRSR
jgi:hypothetical protein